MKTKIIAGEQIVAITNRIRKIYFILVCIGIVNMIIDFSSFSKTVPDSETWQGAINSLLYLVIYLGLRLKTKWLIPLVLFSSAWILLSIFFAVFQPAIDILRLFAKAVSIIYVLFFAYQLHFFSKREVKKHFGLEGTIFF